MAKVERWTNKEKLDTVRTNDPKEIKRLEDQPFDRNSDVVRSRVTELD